MKNEYHPRGLQISKTTIVNLEKGKLPPQALDLEQAIIGALMVDSRAIDELFTVFSSSDVFYKDAHKHIFEAIKELTETNHPVDMLTVSQQLRVNKKLETVGGDFALMQLTQKVSSSAHIEYHARIVLQQYMKRQMISVCSQCIELAYEPDVDVFEMLDRIDVETAAINEVVSKGRTEMTYADALDAVVDKVKTLTDAETHLTGVNTGFSKINKHTGGWQPTDFIVIGARPGMGKTAFVVKTMIDGAKAGNPVGFISLEMSTEQLATRTVAVESNYHMNQLTKSGFEKPEYFSGLLKKVNELRKLPIYIDDRPSLTIGEIKRKARLLKRKHGIKLLIVDYIQLAGGEGNEDIRIRVGKISNGLKAIAKELNIAVIGLAQLSREVEKSAHKRPSLAHLKESGEIEQDADMVAFLFRPEYYGLSIDTEVLDDGENTEFIIAKYRHGGLGTIGLYFDGNKTKFMDQQDMSAVDEHGVIMNGEAEYVPLPKPTVVEAFGEPEVKSDVPF